MGIAATGAIAPGDTLDDALMKGYMTLAEMAEKLGYKNGDGLRSQIRHGALHAEKIGKTWVVSDEEYANYVREHAGKFGPAPKERNDA